MTRAKRTDIWSDQWHGEKEKFNNPVLLSCKVPAGLEPIKLSLNVKACERNRKVFDIKSSGPYPEDTESDHLLLDTTPEEKRLPDEGPLDDKRPLEDRPLEDKHLEDRPLEDRLSPKRLVTICVKPLDFDHDISEHLIQWIEINKILGASKIEIYVRRAHPKTLRILKWYANTQRSRLSVILHKNVDEYIGFLGNKRNKYRTKQGKIQFQLTDLRALVVFRIHFNNRGFNHEHNNTFITVSYPFKKNTLPT